MKTKIIIILATAVFMAVSCANMAPPSGGPVDKEPPAVAASSPANGQVNVDPRVQVSVKFSEWITTAGVSGAVSVYPALPQGVTVRAAKDRITITPKEPLRENTTYHIIIGTSLKDLRGNAITSPISIVFSTGAELDSGTVGGKAASLKALPRTLKAALYRDGGEGEWADAKYFGIPDYAADCDSAGAFKFTNLREGRYRVVAFNDQYRTGRLRHRDTCFTSLEKVINITKEAQAVRLYPAVSDTVVVSVSVDSIVSGVNGVKDINDTNDINDSTSTKKKPAAEICYRLYGSAACLEPDEKRKWVYRPAGQKDTSFTVIDRDGTFSFDSIPASKGTLLWFIDDNGDGLVTPGRLAPWRSPERFFRVPGVIEAKANWEVEVEVEACE